MNSSNKKTGAKNNYNNNDNDNNSSDEYDPNRTISCDDDNEMPEMPEQNEIFQCKRIQMNDAVVAILNTQAAENSKIGNDEKKINNQKDDDTNVTILNNQAVKNSKIGNDEKKIIKETEEITDVKKINKDVDEELKKQIEYVKQTFLKKNIEDREKMNKICENNKIVPAVVPVISVIPEEVPDNENNNFPKDSPDENNNFPKDFPDIEEGEIIELKEDEDTVKEKKYVVEFEDNVKETYNYDPDNDGYVPGLHTPGDEFYGKKNTFIGRKRENSNNNTVDDVNENDELKKAIELSLKEKELFEQEKNNYEKELNEAIQLSLNEENNRKNREKENIINRLLQNKSVVSTVSAVKNQNNSQEKILEEKIKQMEKELEEKNKELNNLRNRQNEQKKMEEELRRQRYWENRQNNNLQNVVDKQNYRISQLNQRIRNMSETIKNKNFRIEQQENIIDKQKNKINSINFNNNSNNNNFNNVNNNNNGTANCPICFESFFYKEMMLLEKCLHAFCKKCARRMLDECTTRTIKCPICRKESTCFKHSFFL